MKIEDEELKKVAGILEKSDLTVAVKYNEPLKKHTSFKIGGPVKVMYIPEDERSAVRLFDVLCEHGIIPHIIGNGSNILADDRELDITVINTCRLKGIELYDTVIRAGSGVLLSELASFALENSLTGLEFAHGIPGTLGGAVVMNAGAYGGEMGDVVYATNAYHIEDGKYTQLGETQGFSYRNSVFAGRSDMILSCAIHLSRGEKDEIEKKMHELIERRRESQPLDMPSAGSIFKRPKDGYAAAMIDEAGLKGYSIGGAQVSPKHAGFIVNTGGAAFDDVIKLIEYVRETVEKRCGVVLELEVAVWK